MYEIDLHTNIQLELSSYSNSISFFFLFGICIPFNNIELLHIVNLFLYALRYLFYLEINY